jgi:hypothetical protein
LNGNSLPGGTLSSLIAKSMAIEMYVPATVVKSTTCCSPRSFMARANV